MASEGEVVEEDEGLVDDVGIAKRAVRRTQGSLAAMSGAGGLVRPIWRLAFDSPPPLVLCRMTPSHFQLCSRQPPPGAALLKPGLACHGMLAMTCAFRLRVGTWQFKDSLFPLRGFFHFPQTYMEYDTAGRGRGRGRGGGGRKQHSALFKKAMRR